MKYVTPIAFVLSLLAAPALGQQLTGDRAVQYNGQTIPAHQAQSPAGEINSDIAFRPGCFQLVPVVQANGNTAWTLQLPGEIRTMKELPSTWADSDAIADLSASGLCKFGSEADGVVRVPIIYTNQLPESVIAEPTASVDHASTSQAVARPTEATASIPMILVGVLLTAGGIGWFAWLLFRAIKTPKPINSNTSSDPLQELLNLANGGDPND